MKIWKRSLGLLMAALLLAVSPAAGLAAPAADERTDEELTFQSEIVLPNWDGTDFPVSEPGKAPRSILTYSEECYGDQLPASSRAIYDAIRESPLWNGPAEHMIELTEYLPEESLTLPGTATVTKEDDSFLLNCALDDEQAVQDMVIAAHTALLYDHPELSWLVNTDPTIAFRVSADPTEEELAAMRELQPGDIFTLATPVVHLESLVYGMSNESVRRATTAPEEVEGPDRWHYADTGNRNDLEAALTSARNEIGDLDGMTDAQKVGAVHDWVCGHVRYADKTSTRFIGNWRGYQTVWSALIEGETVCAGYAKLMKMLLDSYDIPCVIVRGQSRGEAHAWNYVMLSGSWYGLDATWADHDGDIDRRDYLRGSSVFEQDHVAAGLTDCFAFTYPVLAEADYTEGSSSILPGDVNLDGMVNLRDLPALADAMGAERPLSPQALANGDLNESGQIELQDITMLAEDLRKNGYAQGAQPGNDSAVQIAVDAENLQPGDLISVTLSGTGEGICGRLEVSGLEPTAVSSGLSDVDTFVLLPDYGTYAVTYTYRVGTQAKEVSVRASQVCRAEGSVLRRTADASWSVNVGSSGPASIPAPNLQPAVSGFETGLANERTYYAKSSGASTKYYLRSNTGKMTRVAVPSVKTGGQTFYPILSGGSVLFPRVESGQVVCYSTFVDGMDVPILNVQTAVSPALTDGYQTGRMNGRPYYVKVSGASMKYYLKSNSGKMTRVAAPSISAGGTKYYPINHGGTVLWPVVETGKLLSYSAYDGDTESPVLVPALG